MERRMLTRNQSRPCSSLATKCQHSRNCNRLLGRLRCQPIIRDRQFRLVLEIPACPANHFCCFYNIFIIFSARLASCTYQARSNERGKRCYWYALYYWGSCQAFRSNDWIYDIDRACSEWRSGGRIEVVRHIYPGAPALFSTSDSCHHDTMHVTIIRNQPHNVSPNHICEKLHWRNSCWSYSDTSDIMHR